MRFPLRAFFAAASAVYAVGALSAQPPTNVPPTNVPPTNVPPTNVAPVPGFAPEPHRQSMPAAQTAVTSTILNTPEFEIPFSVDSIGAQPVEVQLYVSRDAGTQWEFIGRQPARSRQFPFQAIADGDYWFATRTIDAAGAAHPSGRIAPQLRVTVDTTNPHLEAKADADSNGEIVVDYRISDASAHADGIRIEYMTDAVRQWMPVGIASPPQRGQDENSLVGRAVWVPESEWRHVSVRMMVRDQAGNQTILTRQVERPRVAQQPFQLASRPAPNTAATAPPAAGPSAAESVPFAEALQSMASRLDVPESVYSGASGNNIRYAPDRYASNQLRGLNLSGPTDGNGSPGSSFGAGNAPQAVEQPLGQRPQPDPEPSAPYESQPDQQAGPRTIESATRPLPIEQIPSPAPRQIPSPTPRPAEPLNQVTDDSFIETTDDQHANRQPTDEPDSASVFHNASVRLLEQLPQGSLVRRSNTRTFSLDYEVDAVGSKGLDSIELWCTKDGGQTWKYWDKDPDGQSPFDIITADEGLYGFRMVVVGGNGLTSPRPVPGDNADIYVMVDTVAPKPRITGARYGEGDQTGSLVIDYRCDESNEMLASRPIRFAFAEELDGPWTTIATGLANEGRYLWPADPQLPRRIYLRIEATDKAGNVGVDTLETPIDVQGLAPRARIRGFQPVSETAVRPSGRIR